MDNRISQGPIFQPLSKQKIGMELRPNRLVEFTVNHGGFLYEAKVKEFEELSMADELVLLVCLSMISTFHRGKILHPPQKTGKAKMTGDQQIVRSPQTELLWKNLKVVTKTTENGKIAGLLDYTQVPVLMLETTPTEILKILQWGTGGEQITRLIQALGRLAATTLGFRVQHLQHRFSFSSNLLAYSYSEPMHNTGSPSLRIAINHFSVQTITSNNGGYTLQQIHEKIGMNELENAIHSQLCRLVTPNKPAPVRIEKLLTSTYAGTELQDINRQQKYRFHQALERVEEKLKEYGWCFRKRDETYLDIARPAPPKSEHYLQLADEAKCLTV